MILLAGTLPAPGGWAAGAKSSILYGQVVLKTGEVLEADVALELEDSYIIRGASGLRVLPKKAVESVAARAKSTNGDKISPFNPGKANPPIPPQKKELWPGGPKNPEAGNAPKTPDLPKDDISIKVVADEILDQSRSSGRVPVLKISLAGTIDGKVLDPTDPFTISRLTFFLEEDSRPRFSVIHPPVPVSGSEPAKKDKADPKAEYLVTLSTKTSMTIQTFFGTELLKKFESKVLFQLVRASDKKMVVEVSAVEDEGGDPARRQEVCRKVYERAVETVLKRLRTLKTFGGSSTGS